MTDNSTYAKAAREMANMLYSDSHIPVGLSFTSIYNALLSDERVPDLYEQECLTMGGPLASPIDAEHPDTEGEGSPIVDAKFPRTVAAIKALF